MGIFSRNQYPGAYPGVMPMRRGLRLRSLLLFLAIVFGLYFLNSAFLWVKISAFPTNALKIFNIVTGVLIIILGLTTVIRQRHY